MRNVWSRTHSTIRQGLSVIAPRFLLLTLLFFLSIQLIEPTRDIPLAAKAINACMAMTVAFLWALAAHRIHPFRSLWFFVLTLAGLYAESLNRPEVPLSAYLQWANVGICLYLLDALARNVVRPWLRRTALAGVLVSSLAVGVVLLAVIVFNRSRGVSLDEPTLFAVWETNFDEALGFVQTQLEKDHIIVFGSALCGILGLHLVLSRSQWPGAKIGWHLPALLVLLAIAYRHNSSVVYLIEDTFTRFREEFDQLREGMEQRQAIPGSIQAVQSGPPQTHVVVIGESHNRDHMGAYGYVRNTTPWLERMQGSKGFFLFRNAFSNHTHTTRVLTLALTQAHQYRPGFYWTMPSLIDVAKVAGFETYWLSNQGRIGAHDSPIAILASASDHQQWRKDSLKPGDPVGDMRLVNSLHKLIPGLDQSRHNLIILHLNGSHWPYCEQFPAGVRHFPARRTLEFGMIAKNEETMERIDCYDGSVRYNDEVLAGLFEQAKAIPNLGSFIYFSDHGEEVVEGHAHTVAEFDYRMIQIPFWIWLSPKYIAQHPARARALSRHLRECFTNDLIYDTLIGLMEIDTPHFSPIYDISSHRYSLTCEMARTLHGRMPVEHHPRLALESAKAALAPKAAIAAGIATLGKLHEALAMGFREAELRLVADGAFPRGERLRLGMAPDRLTDGSLAELLQTPAGKKMKRLFLRIEGQDALVRDELDALAAQHPGLAKRAVWERRPTLAPDSGPWPQGVLLDAAALANPATLAQLRSLTSPSGLLFDADLYPDVLKATLPKVARVLWLRQWPELGADHPYLSDPKVRAFGLSFSSSFEP